MVGTNKTYPAICVCCFVPIGIIIGSLIVAEHQRQLNLPMATCDFRGGVFNRDISSYSSKGGQHYESWTVNGTANYTYSNKKFMIIQVIGMYPAPRQKLNLQVQSTATAVQNRISQSLSSCSLEISPSALPLPNVVYTAYPEPISSTVGILLLVFAMIGFCMVIYICLKKDPAPPPTTLDLTPSQEMTETTTTTITDSPPMDRNQSQQMTETAESQPPFDPSPPPYDNQSKEDTEPPPYDFTQQRELAEPSFDRTLSEA